MIRFCKTTFSVTPCQNDKGSYQYPNNLSLSNIIASFELAKITKSFFKSYSISKISTWALFRIIWFVLLRFSEPYPVTVAARSSYSASFKLGAGRQIGRTKVVKVISETVKTATSKYAWPLWYLLWMDTWGQFHQPSGTKRKCTDSHSSAPLGAVQFHQQNNAQLHPYAQLENTLNFNTARPALCANKFNVNPLAAFGQVECG